MTSSQPQEVLKDLGFALLSEGKIIRLRAGGFSMYPAISPGSVVYVEPVLQASGLQPGDIIVWRRNQGFVAHRLVRKFEKDNREYFVTRGDSKMHEDPPVTGEVIAGKVIRLEYPEGKEVILKSYSNRKPCYMINKLSVRIFRIFRKIRKLSGLKSSA